MAIVIKRFNKMTVLFHLEGGFCMKVYKGSAFKKWFLSKENIRRVLIPSGSSFHILNLDEINDEEYYVVLKKDFNEVVIEEVELVCE